MINQINIFELDSRINESDKCKIIIKKNKLLIINRDIISIKLL